MAQIIVRNLDEDIKRALKERARQNGRSMEEEVREILNASVSARAAPRINLGTAIAARFAGIGLDMPIVELRGQEARPAVFDE